MKRIVTILLSAVLVLSLVGCGSAPSDKKIKAALEEGTVTFEDAKAKGWIDDKWIEENFEPIEAKSKIHLFEAFETSYLDGTPVSSEIIEGKMCLVFFNTQGEGAMEGLEIYNDAYDKMKELGVPIMGIITDEDVSAAKEKLTHIKFPVIVYSEDMQKSLKDYKGIIGENIVSVFTKDGGFYTAWNSKVEMKEMLSFAEVLANEE